MAKGFDIQEDASFLGDRILLERIRNAFLFADFNSKNETKQAIKYIDMFILRFEEAQKNVKKIIENKEKSIVFLNNFFNT